jgi:hypothetical protein
MRTELDLFKRRIVAVVNYFDEEREMPWDYVMRTGNGRFEAVETVLLDDRAVEHSLGRHFVTPEAAMEALREHLHPQKIRQDEAMNEIRSEFIRLMKGFE